MKNWRNPFRRNKVESSFLMYSYTFLVIMYVKLYEINAMPTKKLNLGFNWTKPGNLPVGKIELKNCFRLISFDSAMTSQT